MNQDAIAIAIRYGCPIYTYEDILSRAEPTSISSLANDTIFPVVSKRMIVFKAITTT